MTPVAAPLRIALVGPEEFDASRVLPPLLERALA